MNRRPSCVEDVYERWLRRRLNYAAIRATGTHAPESFLHLMLHYGDNKQKIMGDLSRLMWTSPSEKEECQGKAFYKWPEEIQDTLDLRFESALRNKYCMTPSGQLELKGVAESSKWTCVPGGDGPGSTYSPSYATILTGPSWQWTKDVLKCPHPHQHETPRTWTLTMGPELCDDDPYHRHGEH